MDEIRETRDQRNGTMPMRQWNTGSKSALLRKLEESSTVHFEKVLPTSSVNLNGEPRLTLPADFVGEHGDKLQKYVVLRPHSSLVSWTVTLSIESRRGHRSDALSDLVRFRGGWQNFVSFNSLLEGDTLVFSLTAMSEFEVYIFREDSGSPEPFPSLATRVCSKDSELARKRARPSPESKDEQFVAKVKIQGLIKSEEFQAYTSSKSCTPFHLSSYSDDLDLLESENSPDCSPGRRPGLRSGREPAIGHDKFNMMSGVGKKDGPARQSDATMKKENEYQDSARAGTSRNRQLPRFCKKLAVGSNIHPGIHLPERGRSAAFMASNALHSSKETFVNDLQQSKMHRGKVFFERKMSLSSLPPRATMTLPKLFVQQHGDQFQKYVTLRNEGNGQMWTVKINIMFCGNRPQVCFNRGWRDFATSNELVIGDRLTFVLVAKSLFHVFILRAGVNPGLSVEKPNLWSRNPLPDQRETRMSPVPQQGCKISADGCQKSENPLSGISLAKNTAVETSVAKAALDSPDSSQSASDMDSHFFEPMFQQKELERVSKAVNNSAGLDHDQSMLPYFIKRTTMSSILEIPINFLTMNYTRLGTRVRLQGIHDDSPEYTVACCSVNDMGRLRIFFRKGWSNFANENVLQVGQRLVFTLTADSFFVVRNV